MANISIKDKPVVSVLKTKPYKILSDYHKLMALSSYKEHLDKKFQTILKLNLSWSLYYPACSTEPWQLDGVLKTLRDDGYKKIVAVENQTVVTHPWTGAYDNKWLPILKEHNVDFKALTNVEWEKFKPKTELLAMPELFDKIMVPKMFKGANVIHLPTMKTHGHTTTTGAIKNAFGGLIPKYRHHAHKMLHEVLVDLLAIQKELHKGVYAVMDGTIAGNGAGPRTMVPYEGNIILSGADQVAIDAVSAHIMGFDPMKIPYIKMAHDRGLGIGDIRQIDISGMSKKDLLAINFRFKTKKSPIIYWDQTLRKRTSGGLHKFLFHSPVFRTFIFASEFYHNYLWYPTIGKSRIRKFETTEWGKLFESYGYGKMPKYAEVKDWDPY